MKKLKTRLLMKEFVTHDVKRFILDKPKNYRFVPGQATLLTINNPEYQNKENPFTFTSLNKDKVLEFIIKKYPKHKKGVTKKLHELNVGEEILISEAFGAITYQGKGVFIAGGAGITPFIAIFRDLQDKNKLKNHKLIFSNKTSKDIILEKEFREMFGSNLILTVTQEKNKKYHNKKINKDFLKKHIKNYSQKFYICGPQGFVKDIKRLLLELGVKKNNLIIENF